MGTFVQGRVGRNCRAAEIKKEYAEGQSESGFPPLIAILQVGPAHVPQGYTSET